MTITNHHRTPTRHIDGTLVFGNAQDHRNEDAVADMLARAWRCELHRFAELCPLDWYATRYERLVGVAELKVRLHAVDRYPTVFLNVRKWMALNLASVGLGVPSVFVVRFTDALCWCPVGLSMGHVRIDGRHDRRKASDIEPLIEVAVADMNGWRGL